MRSSAGDVVKVPRVSQLVAPPVANAIAMLHVVSTRDGDTTFHGVFAFDPESGAVTRVYDVSSTQLGTADERVKRLEPGCAGSFTRPRRNRG